MALSEFARQLFAGMKSCESRSRPMHHPTQGPISLCNSASPKARTPGRLRVGRNPSQCFLSDLCPAKSHRCIPKKVPVYPHPLLIGADKLASTMSGGSAGNTEEWGRGCKTLCKSRLVGGQWVRKENCCYGEEMWTEEPCHAPCSFPPLLTTRGGCDPEPACVPAILFCSALFFKLYLTSK